VNAVTGPVCAFCRPGGMLREDQILLEGRYLYLCVPEGQIIEGYLIVAPYHCHAEGERRGCMADLAEEELRELSWFRDVTEDFYLSSYDRGRRTYYEQGRAGGGAATDPTGRFRHHAHLCGLPVTLDLHAVLAPRFTCLELSGFSELPRVVAGRPYVYADSVATADVRRRSVFVPRDERAARELETMRLKPIIAKLLGDPDRWNWRVYPGDTEAKHVRRAFATFWRRRGPDWTSRMP